MKQYEAVIRVMEENGGYATLGLLYGKVPKIPDCQMEHEDPVCIDPPHCPGRAVLLQDQTRPVGLEGMAGAVTRRARISGRTERAENREVQPHLFPGTAR